MRYVGCSSRAFRSRIFEHVGRSVRTGRVLGKLPFSAIREHSIENDHNFSESDFEILGKFTDGMEALIGEKYFIDKIKPELNNYR